jgi:uncharacterized protein with PIN domain
VTVRCPQCGREYGEGRFAFGRTIHCACGWRVGAEAVPREPAAAAPPRFLADAMLGRLARWLRILGFDTAYEPDIADARLVRRAIEEDRIILTRDRLLPTEWRVEGIHVISTDAPLEQLRDVCDAFALVERMRLFTRCSRCNAPLRVIARDAARGHVPDRVLEASERFMRCDACERVYWSGSHVERMRRIVATALNPEADR